MRGAWFDLALILLSPPVLVPDTFQGTRALRVLRLARFLRAAALGTLGIRLLGKLFGPRKFHYVVLIAVAVVGFGAVGIYLAETGVNKTITSLEDGLWWAVVTVTTVGYGDVSPVTREGRLIALVLMLVGIGVIGIFTATVASLFVEQAKQDAGPQVEDRLASLERKIEALTELLEKERRERPS